MSFWRNVKVVLKKDKVSVEGTGVSGFMRNLSYMLTISERRRAGDFSKGGLKMCLRGIAQQRRNFCDAALGVFQKRHIRDECSDVPLFSLFAMLNIRRFVCVQRSKLTSPLMPVGAAFFVCPRSRSKVVATSIHRLFSSSWQSPRRS